MAVKEAAASYAPRIPVMHPDRNPDEKEKAEAFALFKEKISPMVKRDSAAKKP
jgi:hypothetical protein